MRDGLALKDWFVKSAETYLINSTQMSLGFGERKKKDSTNEVA